MDRRTFTQPLPQDMKKHAASGHDEHGNLIVGNWHSYPEIAAAGLWTTPSDLAKFAMEVQNGVTGPSKMLSKGMIDQYLTPSPFESYGLGIVLRGKERLPETCLSGSKTIKS